jgi:hypothetical protein
LQKIKKIMEYGHTAHNRSVYAAPPVGGLASIRLGHGLRLPRLIPAHFVSPGLCFAKPLYGLAKRRKQPERYVPFGLKFFVKYIGDTIDKIKGSR